MMFRRKMGAGSDRSIKKINNDYPAKWELTACLRSLIIGLVIHMMLLSYFRKLNKHK